MSFEKRDLSVIKDPAFVAYLKKSKAFQEILIHSVSPNVIIACVDMLPSTTVDEWLKDFKKKKTKTETSGKVIPVDFTSSNV